MVVERDEFVVDQALVAVANAQDFESLQRAGSGDRTAIRFMRVKTFCSALAGTFIESIYFLGSPRIAICSPSGGVADRLVAYESCCPN